MNLSIKNKNIGILGGAFDPIHLGHINLAIYALQETKIDEIWFLPSYRPPHKNFNMFLEYHHRYEMVNISIKNILNFKNCNFEKELCDNNILDITSTYDVLINLKKEFVNFNFYIIIGLDSLYQLDTWKNFDKLIDEFEFLVGERELNNNSYINYSILKNYKIKYKKFYNNSFNISSTEIRNKIYDINFLSKNLNKNVIKYIKDNNLYV